MPDLTELQRLAEGATPGPWRYDYEHGYCGEIISADGCSLMSFSDEPARYDAAFIAAMSPDTAKKLIAVAQWADALVNPPQMATGYHQRKQREADEDNLRTALEELK